MARATKKKTTKKKKGTREKAKSKLQLATTGSTMLNLAISNKVNGGYPIGRVINIVGDKSSGKTLLAIEALASAIHKLSGEKTVVARYLEVESAFDKPYAELLGLPVDQVEFPNDPDNEDANTIETVEDWYEDMEAQTKRDDFDEMIYIVDSMDALSSRAELATDIDKGTFGGAKPKKINELFRRLVRKIEKSNITLIMISQQKDKIGVTFGERKTRSGGKALDFFSSVIIWLSELGKIKKGSGKKERIIGLRIKVKIKKNKVWLPFREADYNILFNYGIDDIGSMLDFLKEQKPDTEWYTPGNRFINILEAPVKKKKKGKAKKEKTYTRDAFIDEVESSKKLLKALKKEVKRLWNNIEEGAEVKRKPKYG